jgi:ribulose-phosphate 3-epimerase
MKPTICPAVTAATPDEFRRQIERATSVAVRLHLDVSDGELTPSRLIEIEELWWPGNAQADIHVMYRRPFEHAALLLNLRPQLIIVHAEAEGDFISFAKKAHSQGVEVGVAIQQDTQPEVLLPAMEYIDHVLIFSGKLGYFGGEVDLSLLDKARRLRAMKPQIEIGWDGGVKPDNIRQLAEGGIDVLNSGGFFQQSADAHEAYESLTEALNA